MNTITITIERFGQTESNPDVIAAMLKAVLHSTGLHVRSVAFTSVRTDANVIFRSKRKPKGPKAL